VMSLFLEREGRLEAHREECEVLEGREWQRDDDEATAFLRVKRINGLDAQGLRVLRAVWQYRDGQARRMDRPAFKVLPDDVLVALAQNRPTEEEALHNLLKRGSPMLRRHGEGLLQAVRAGVADNSPLPDREPKTRGRSSGVSSSQIERILGPLKDWRNRMVNEKGLNPVVIANNNVLKEIARLAPTSLEALGAVPGIRDWQVRDFGDEIVAVVARLGPERSEPSDAAGAKRRRRRRR
jgi:ribonuclease D